MDSQFLNRDHQPSRLHLLAEAADPRAHPLTLDNLRIEQGQQRWRCLQCGRDRAAAFSPSIGSHRVRMFITTTRVGRAAADRQQRDYRVCADSVGAGSHPD